VKPHFGQRTILFSLEAISIDPFPKTEETIKTLKLSEASGRVNLRLCFLLFSVFSVRCLVERLRLFQRNRVPLNLESFGFSHLLSDFKL
jgi:hypothetical protein